MQRADCLQSLGGGLVMKIIEVDDYEQMSQEAADIVIETVRLNPETVLGLATGGTPLGTYKCLVRDHQKNGTSYQQVHTINLDEYVGVSPQDKQSYFYYMNKHFFNGINMPMNQVHIPNGMVDHPEDEAKQYNQMIHSLGRVHLQILGIGKNGHIGFNEPGTSFEAETHVVELTPSTRKANAKYFSSISEVPSQAITMGITSIMKAEQIILLASGIEKADILFQCITGDISEDVPASILQRHSNVTIIADQEALTVVKEKSEVHLGND